MSELLLIKQAGNILSKKQQQFNKLIRSVEMWRKQLIEMEKRFRRYRTATETELSKPRKAYSEALLQLMKLLDGHYESGALTKSEQKKLVQMLLNISSQSAPSAENEADYEALVNKYARLQEEGMSRKEKEASQDMLKEMFSAAFGVDLEEDVDFSDPGNLGEKLHQKFTGNRHREHQEDFARFRQKTYSGLGKKMTEKAALLQKSWKMLYNKLVKKLHPDLEQDEEKKIHKTGILQEVTQAYEKNDFYTLLTIYQQEVGFNEVEEQDNQLNNDDQVSQYITILKRQESELRGKSRCASV